MVGTVAFLNVVFYDRFKSLQTLALQDTIHGGTPEVFYAGVTLFINSCHECVRVNDTIKARQPLNRVTSRTALRNGAIVENQ